MINFLWAFMAFVFYKVMAAFLLDADLSPSGAIVMGITTALIIFVIGGAYVVAASSNLKGSPEWRTIVLRCVAIFALAIAANSFASYLIVKAFSEDFSWTVFGSNWRDDSYWFIVMCAIPMLVHLLMTLQALTKMRHFL